jgi:hypothetical protein
LGLEPYLDFILNKCFLRKGLLKSWEDAVYHYKQLDSTGMALTSADLIKPQIIALDRPSELQIHTIWRQIEEILHPQKISLTKFFHALCLIENIKMWKSNQIAEDFVGLLPDIINKKRISNPLFALRFLKEVAETFNGPVWQEIKESSVATEFIAAYRLYTLALPENKPFLFYLLKKYVKREANQKQSAAKADRRSMVSAIRRLYRLPWNEFSAAFQMANDELTARGTKLRMPTKLANMLKAS